MLMVWRASIGLRVPVVTFLLSSHTRLCPVIKRLAGAVCTPACLCLICGGFHPYAATHACPV